MGTWSALLDEPGIGFVSLLHPGQGSLWRSTEAYVPVNKPLPAQMLIYADVPDLVKTGRHAVPRIGVEQQVVAFGDDELGLRLNGD